MLKTLNILITIFVFSLIIPNSVNAATYYVSTSGNDANSGTTENTPWKTVAKINSVSFQPGDSILFRRGETWPEQLIVPSSGAVNNPVTFADYGSGALPIISGAGTSPAAFFAKAKNYLIIRNFDFNATGAEMGLNLQQTTNILITGSVVRNSQIYDGLYIHGGAADTHDIIVEGCTVHHNKQYGNISVAGKDPNLDGPANIIIRNNIIYSAGSTGADHGIYFRFGIGGQIYGNTIYSNSGNGINLRSWQGASVYGNTIYGNNNGLGLAKLVGGVNTIDNTIYNNVFYDNITNNVATQLQTNPQSNYFYFNTFVTARTNEFQQDSTIAGLVFKNNIFYHDGSIYSGKYLYRSGTNSLTGNIFNWNCLYLTNGINIALQNSTPHTFTSWKNLHGFPVSGSSSIDQPDSNSIFANPNFIQVNDITNQNTFAQLQSTSPCRGAGVTIPEITTDKNGVIRPDPPTIGAYEYTGVSSTASPTPIYNIADLEPDGDVDGNDFNILVSNFNLTGILGWIRSDILKNGIVDIFDFNKLITNFGQ